MSAITSRSIPSLRNAIHRASSVVVDYLEAEFSRPELRAGARLPTVRELAKQLNVSPGTVQTVFRKLAEDGRIETKVGSGTYLVSPRGKKADVFKIALGLHVAGGSFASGWKYRVSMGVLQASGAHIAPRVSLLPLAHAGDDGDAVARELLAEAPSVDGVVLFPFARRAEVYRAYEKAGKPAVNFNADSLSATANFVSPDYFDSAYRAGKAWQETGRKRIALVSFPLAMMGSSNLLYAGLVNGLGVKHDRGTSCRVFPVESWVENHGYEAGRAMLADKEWRPDAVYCVGDYIALGVLQAFREAGLRVPEDVSVLGGTGLDLSNSAEPRLTRAQQPLEAIGERLLTMLCERIENEHRPVPGVLLPMPYVGGATTRTEENSLFGTQA